MIKKSTLIFRLKVLTSFIGVIFVVYYAIIRPAIIAKKKNLENVEAVKEGLAKGFEECRERWKNKKTTKFTDIPPFFAEYDGFEIKANPSTKIIKEWRRGERVKIKESFSSNSCFEARAIPKTNKNTWFKYLATEYDINHKCFICTRERGLRVIYTCGDPSKTGCPKGKVWRYW